MSDKPEKKDRNPKILIVKKSKGVCPGAQDSGQKGRSSKRFRFAGGRKKTPVSAVELTPAPSPVPSKPKKWAFVSLFFGFLHHWAWNQLRGCFAQRFLWGNLAH